MNNPSFDSSSSLSVRISEKKERHICHTAARQLCTWQYMFANIIQEDHLSCFRLVVRRSKFSGATVGSNEALEIKSSGGSGGGDGLVSVGEFGSKRAEQ